MMEKLETIETSTVGSGKHIDCGLCGQFLLKLEIALRIRNVFSGKRPFFCADFHPHVLPDEFL